MKPIGIEYSNKIPSDTPCIMKVQGTILNPCNGQRTWKMKEEKARTVAPYIPLRTHLLMCPLAVFYPSHVTV